MATNTVQLTDIIDTVVYQDLPAIDSPERTAFYESGIVVRNSLLDGIANAPGKTAELPFWRDIDADNEPNLSNDNPATEGDTHKIIQGDQVARKAFLNKGLSETDLASELAMGGDAMRRIRARVDTYWMRQWQRRLVASCNGIYANNIKASGSGGNDADMVYDASGATNDDVGAATVFNRQNFTTAAFTAGDAYDRAEAVAVHSVVYKRMIDNDDIDFIPDSQGRMTIPTFLGLRVIVDDGMPFTPAAGSAGGADAPKFTSIIFGNGAFGWGEGSPRLPVEVQREARQGNGGGIEILWTRKTWLLHPFGFAVSTTKTPASVSFDLAELAEDDTWERVVDRKNVPLSFLVTNG